MLPMQLPAKRRWHEAPCKLPPCRHSAPERREFEQTKHHKCCRGCLHIGIGFGKVVALWKSTACFTKQIVRSFGQLATPGLGQFGFDTAAVRHVHWTHCFGNLVAQPESFETLARRLVATHASPRAVIVGGQK